MRTIYTKDGTRQEEPNRAIVYKRCAFHARFRTADPQALEDMCIDCRRAGFRATMRARGCLVTMPTYGGKWPAGTLAEWIRGCDGWKTAADVAA